MKLIALTNFRNVPSLRLKEEQKDGTFESTVEGAKHESHIHKGAILEIGPAVTGTGTFEEQLLGLRKKDTESAQLISMLIMSGCVGDATNEKVVKAVKDEIAVDEKREKSAAALQARADLSHLGQAIIENVSK